jgi:hypothetical protein
VACYGGFYNRDRHQHKTDDAAGFKARAALLLSFSRPATALAFC